MRRSALKLGRLAAERRYTWRYKRESGTLCVRIGVPRPNPGGSGEWVCPVQMAGAPATMDDPRVHPVYGGDALHALQLALRFLHGELAVRAPLLNLTWLDGTKLGFEGIVMFPGVARAVGRAKKVLGAKRPRGKKPREARASLR